MVTFTYDIDFSGEMAAGLRPFTDTVKISVESNDPGGDAGEFEAFMMEGLRDWYDGASVVLVNVHHE
jgi:hypothetical protein